MCKIIHMFYTGNIFHMIQFDLFSGFLVFGLFLGHWSINIHVPKFPNCDIWIIPGGSGEEDHVEWKPQSWNVKYRCKDQISFHTYLCFPRERRMSRCGMPTPDQSRGRRAPGGCVWAGRPGRSPGRGSSRTRSAAAGPPGSGGCPWWGNVSWKRIFLKLFF